MSQASSNLRDPVCGMPVQPSAMRWTEHSGSRYYFCSSYCELRFRESPSMYAGRLIALSESDHGPRAIAYFSMEIAVDPDIPTYAGGLGILAGDMLRSCADLRIPIVGVSLLYRGGYLNQVLDAHGHQKELAVLWSPDLVLRATDAETQITLHGRSVRVRAWEYNVHGVSGGVVPVYFLDSDVDGNHDCDRALTGTLYGGDSNYRICQEIILGIAGLRILRQLGHNSLRTVHLNEGHAAFAAWELLHEFGAKTCAGFDLVRSKCIFTTHTPIPAGHDQFTHELVRQALAPIDDGDVLTMLGGREALNMTSLALNLSKSVNGVAIKHQETTESMFPGYEIGHVTNGVHSLTWTHPRFKEVFDQCISGWRNDPSALRRALSIPDASILEPHDAAKRELLELVERRTGTHLDPRRLTIGFGRRATSYKRADLIFENPDRLRWLARGGPGIQIVFAGKAHRYDDLGKNLIQRIFDFGRQLAGDLPVVYLENYGMSDALALVAGVDLWLNTPQPPLEASGTSGMKAAHNGVPSLSTRDGWWIEGHVEGITGWSIESACDLYERLEYDVIPAFESHDRWACIMKHTIALNASYFNTHRMVQEYAASAYLNA